MALLQPNNPAGIATALAQHGPAQGPRKLLLREQEAAEAAAATGVYTVFRCDTNPAHPDFCTRVAPAALCFCGHSLAVHATYKGVAGGACNGAGHCKCRRFRYIPFRPEEVGEWWLPRRKGFNVKQWKAKCKCKCGSDEHNEIPPYRCKKCACGGFQSDFLCVVCDRNWEEHDTISQTKGERESQGLPVGAGFFPLSDFPSMQQLVFEPGAGAASRVRPPQVAPEHAEKSVRLMAKNAGGLGLTVAASEARGSRGDSKMIAEFAGAARSLETGDVGGTKAAAGRGRHAAPLPGRTPQQGRQGRAGEASNLSPSSSSSSSCTRMMGCSCRKCAADLECLDP